MNDLGLQFKLADLVEEGRAFSGDISSETVGERVKGLVGDLGYRAMGPAAVKGTAYLAQREVVIDANIEAKVGFGCVRCLAKQQLDIKHRLHIVIAPEPEGGVPDDLDLEMDDGVDDADMAYYKGEEVALEELILEYIVLEMPMNPTCQDALPEAQCQQDVEAEAKVAKDAVDPRWAPLQAMKAAMEAEGKGEPERKD